MYMTNKKNRGFGAYEILTVFVMLLIIVVVMLARVFKTDYNEKYAVMENNARMFALTATNLYIEEEIPKVYYLQMIMDKKLLSNIKNPFKGKKYCDAFTSKVEIENDKKYVSLECGNYLIYKQNYLDKSYNIYQVGKWSSKKIDGEIQSEIFYNYMKDGKKVFSDNLDASIFLYQFNKLNGTDYEDIKEIPKQYEILKEKKYRYLKKIR